MRERARKIKCIDEVRSFEKCCKDTGVLSPFKCKLETANLKDCMAKWFFDDEYVKECTQIYLDQRSEYRRTGISKKQKQRMAVEQEEANNT